MWPAQPFANAVSVNDSPANRFPRVAATPGLKFANALGVRVRLSEP